MNLRKRKEKAVMWKSSLLVLAAIFLGACASTREVSRPFEWEKGTQFREVGLASWYGEDYHGRRTANGEIYDMNAMTSAHRTLPFNTRVRVTNLENGKRCDSRINDRGPFIPGRIIDLSKSGAKELGILGPGTARVAVEVIGWPGIASPSGFGIYAIQVGSFAERGNADRLREDLARRHSAVHILSWESNTRRFYRVRLGAFRTEEEARRYFPNLEKENLTGFVVRED